MQVTAQFYETAVADALIRSYESETNSTAALERRIGDLVGEGYATKPDLARVRTKAKNDRYELKKANDRAELARARLADILRFMPGEPALKADGASMMKVLENPRRLTLEDAVMESLTNRLDLFAADRVTKVREIEIYRALTEWLPEIAVAGGGNYANQELLATSQFWSGGIVGAIQHHPQRGGAQGRVRDPREPDDGGRRLRDRRLPQPRTRRGRRGGRPLGDGVGAARLRLREGQV